MVGVDGSKSYSGFELCSPFLTSKRLIQLGPKSAKSIIWGGLGGEVGWLGR